MISVMPKVEMSITKINGFIELQFGAVLLNLLSEDELYHACLHEFSHHTAAVKDTVRENMYYSWLVKYKNSIDPELNPQTVSKVIPVLAEVFDFPDMLYLFNYMLYSYASSILVETAADRAMSTHGTAAVAASALLKLKYADMFEWEDEIADEACAFEPEQPAEDFLRKRANKLSEAISQRGDMWNEYAAKEILSLKASHPTFVMRLENLGVKEIRLCPGNSSEQYREEGKKALEFVEKLILDNVRNSYEQDRETQYLKPKKAVDEWMEKGMPLVTEEYADMIQNFRMLCRFSEAEQLCDRVIAELEPTSAAFAMFIKGNMMLHRYDKAGIDLLYRAIELNANFTEEGLEAIGSYCCLTGEAELLADYRNRAVPMTQKQLDEDVQLSFLSKKDHLSCDTMPKELLDRILFFMLSVGEDIIEEIYLVRKTVSETFFASVFVIRFYGGTDQQRADIMHKIFRYLDSTPEDRQFALFDYFNCPEIKFEKIKGSTVYSKEQAKKK